MDYTSNDYLKNMFNLSNKNIIVIGSGSGIGRSASLSIAVHGGNLICADIQNIESTIKAVKEINSEVNVIPFEIDITNKSEIIKLMDEYDVIDGVVCTPSINVRKLLIDYTESEFDKVISLNLKATFNVLQASVKKMKLNNKGSIIAFSSIRGSVVEPGQSVYAASKAGTEKLVNTLAAEMAQYNIRVNTISPGPVMTPLTDQLRNDKLWNEAYTTKPALQRWAQPNELAGGIIYLLSDASSYVTATNLIIDAGWINVDGRFNPNI